MGSSGSLNHIYRTVWNQALGAMVAIAEISTTRGKSGSQSGICAGAAHTNPPLHLRTAVFSVALALAWGATPTLVMANPTGGVVVQGQASFTANGNNLLVTTQNGAGLNHSAINWQSFSVPSGSTTYFQQPNASSTSINRVVTNTPSQIFGTLGSNGNLVLVNQSGITVGAGAVVDTAGFTASALRMSDADAMAGRLRFGDGTSAGGGVSVQGNVLGRWGDVVLMGSSVDTGSSALVQAPNGSTILAAGQQIEITGRGLEGIVMQVQAPTDSAVNLGTLKGDAVGIFAGTLKHSGLIQATTATLEGGKVVLKSSGDAYVQGSGKIDVSSATGKGGQIEVLGNRVAVMDSAVLDASGASGGGTVLVGGDKQGKNPEIQNSTVTYFGPQASIKADATVNGDGGRAIVWGTTATAAFGTISAKGGALGGDGGFVETSGSHLDVNGIRVDASAVNGGKPGTWLLDPTDIQITSANQFFTSSTATGVQTFFSNALNTTGTASSISVGTIATALASFDVIVDTSLASPGTGSQTGNILVSGTSLSVPNSQHKLTLNANGNIDIFVGIDLVSGGGIGDLALNAPNGNVTLGSFSNINVRNLLSSAINFSQTDTAVTTGSAPSITATLLNVQGGTVSLGAPAGSTVTAGSVTGNLSGSLSLINTGSFFINGNLAVGALNLTSTLGSITETSAGTITVTGATIVNAAGTIDLTAGLSGLSGITNNFNSFSGQGTNVWINDVNSLTFSGPTTASLGTVKAFAGGSITLPVSSNMSGYGGVILQSANAVNLASSVTATSGDIVVATGTGLSNTVGSAVFSSSGRWLVYSSSLANNSFGGLISDQLPLWGRTYTINQPVTEAGNRYLFSTVPSLSVSLTNGNIVKTYGTAAVAPGFVITGLVDAALYGNVFTQETYTSALSAISNGFAVNAPVLGSPYAVTYSGTLTAPTGYGPNVLSAATGTVTVNPLTVAWTGGAGTGLWSSSGNWSSSYVPDGVNVLLPQSLSVTNAIYDLTVPTSIQSINATGSFTLQSGALTVNGDLITPSYIQTGGALTGTGALTVTNSFSQSAGSIAMTGPVSITQASGNLVAGSISGSSISLQAVNGAISQTAPLVTAGLLKVSAANGVMLTDTGNAISAFNASTTGTGDISLYNNGALDVQGITLANGNLSIETHSPITVSGGVTASGNIVLAALTKNLTSNITLNGSMTSTGGGISIQSYNNFIQNSRLSAALGIDVSTIAGSLTFGPGAYSIGNPVTYSVNGVSYMPPWIAATLSGGATDFVVAFLDQFQAVLDAQQVASIDDPLGLAQRGLEGIVVEGEICKP